MSYIKVFLQSSCLLAFSSMQKWRKNSRNFLPHRLQGQCGYCLEQPRLAEWMGDPAGRRWTNGWAKHQKPHLRSWTLTLGGIWVGVGRCATSWCDLALIFVLAVVSLTFKILSGLYLGNHIRCKKLTLDRDISWVVRV